MNLKQAIAADRLGQFIAEHEGEEGDAEALETTLRSMAGKSKEAPAASSLEDRDD